MPLRPARKCLTLQEKLEMVRYYNVLAEEKKQAKLQVVQVLPRGASKSEKEQHKKKILEAKTKLKMNLQKCCLERFKGRLGKAQLCKWVKRAIAERWEDIPDAVRRKQSTTGNQWASKVGLALRGRSKGGTIPLVLQRELDYLVADMSLGASSISARREVVTAECIETWHPIRRVFLFN